MPGAAKFCPQPVMKKTQSPARAWIAALENPAFAFEAATHGAPGRLRIPPGWVVRRKLPREHLLHFPLEGSFMAQVGGREFRVEKGGLLWVPAGVAFHFWLPPGERLFASRFRLTPREPLPWPSAAPFAWYPDAERCRPWFEAIIAEAGAHEAEPFRASRLRAMLVCLFSELARLEDAAGRKSPPAGGHRLSRSQREALGHFLAERVPHAGRDGWPAPADLARHLRLSPDYFTRLFTRSYGKPPRRWLLEERIHLAALRLEESRLNITEVALEFGYESVFLFSRQFKAVLGRSPGHWRREKE